MLGAVENLTLTGGASINGTGNALNNAISGNAGINVLNGAAGVDTMRGRGGNDFYVVDNVNDTVDEAFAGSSGSDTVQSFVSFSLANTARVRGAVERLVLLDGANINGTGNALEQRALRQYRRERAERRRGADIMRGGGGNDVYVVDNVLDTVDEAYAGSGGIDEVQSSISFSLANSAHVLGGLERLLLLGGANINGTGNSLSNVLQRQHRHERAERGRRCRHHARARRQRHLRRRQRQRHGRRGLCRIGRQRHGAGIVQLQPVQFRPIAGRGRKPDAAPAAPTSMARAMP